MGLFSKLFESSNSKSFDNMLTLHSSITRALAGVAYFDWLCHNIKLIFRAYQVVTCRDILLSVKHLLR